MCIATIILQNMTEMSTTYTSSATTPQSSVSLKLPGGITSIMILVSYSMTTPDSDKPSTAILFSIMSSFILHSVIASSETPSGSVPYLARDNTFPVIAVKTTCLSGIPFPVPVMFCTLPKTSMRSNSTPPSSISPYRTTISAIIFW